MGLIGVLKIGIFSEIGIFNISDNPHNRDHSWVIQTGRFFGNLEGGLPGFGNGARGEGNADRSAGIACFLCGGGDFCGGSCLAALLPCCLAARDIECLHHPGYSRGAFRPLPVDDAPALAPARVEFRMGEAGTFHGLVGVVVRIVEKSLQVLD